MLRDWAEELSRGGAEDVALDSGAAHLDRLAPPGWCGGCWPPMVMSRPLNLFDRTYARARSAANDALALRRGLGGGVMPLYWNAASRRRVRTAHMDKASDADDEIPFRVSYDPDSDAWFADLLFWRPSRLSDEKMQAPILEWDGRWSEQTNRALERLKAKRLDLNENWALCAPYWNCPGCRRSTADFNFSGLTIPGFCIPRHKKIMHLRSP